jgi:hypothetical protein
MSFYSEIAADTLSLLTEFGQSVTRRTHTAGTYSPSTGSVTPVTADTTRKGVLLPFSAGQTMVRGGLVQGGDMRLYLDATGAVALTDHYIVNSVEYVVISYAETNPAGTAILFDIHLRT